MLLDTHETHSDTQWTIGRMGPNSVDKTSPLQSSLPKPDLVGVGVAVVGALGGVNRNGRLCVVFVLWRAAGFIFQVERKGIR